MMVLPDTEADSKADGRADRGAGPEAEGAADAESDHASGSHGARSRGAVVKSASAYRTISEVSEELEVPQHVLRFWETKFSQVRPLKRGGGRRYYRPEDVTLLRDIQKLLYQEGYTIKGVQRLLREGRAGLTQRASHDVADMVDEPDVYGDTDDVPGGAAAEVAEPEAAELSSDLRAELNDLLNELKTLRALLRPESED